VLKTTSPAEGRSAPNDSPESLVPSLRTRVAVGIGGIVEGGWWRVKSNYDTIFFERKLTNPYEFQKYRHFDCRAV